MSNDTRSIILFAVRQRNRRQVRSKFTPDAIVFVDGSQAFDVDVVILGTGYDLRVPFLEASGEITMKPKSTKRDRGLTTNLRYLFPLRQHIFSLSASYPTNALAFIWRPNPSRTVPRNSHRACMWHRALSTQAYSVRARSCWMNLTPAKMTCGHGDTIHTVLYRPSYTRRIHFRLSGPSH